MNSTTLMDNLLFWSIVIPVIWLVWESHKPTVYYRSLPIADKAQLLPYPCDVASKAHSFSKKGLTPFFYINSPNGNAFPTGRWFPFFIWSHP